jgi:hypothetical protein
MKIMTLLLSIILILSLIGIALLVLNLLGLKKELAVSKTARIRNFEVSNKQITELTESNRELELENKKLQARQSAQEEQIVNLKNALKPDSFDGFFPICSNCKDIRDPKGYWHSIEEYVESLSDADLSHSLCPECAKKLYPDLFDGDKKAICLKWKPGSDTPM